MIVFFKNFKRTDRVLLSIQSVRHFFPSADIRCLNLYLENKSEYDEYLNIFKDLNVKVYLDKKKYNFSGPSAGSSNNGLYFTEGINKMFNLSEGHTKVLMLDEDSFFTTGETLRFIFNTEFDLAYGTWPSPAPNNCEQINGSIIAINCKTLSDIFPIPERPEFIENLLGLELHQPAIKKNLKVISIPTRIYTNYGGDGVHTNDIDVIKKELANANIRFK